MVSVLTMSTNEPNADKSQGTGHGSNPTPATAPNQPPADDGSAESEHYQKERAPSTEHEVEPPT